MEESIGADPWKRQPHRKKSFSCSSHNLNFDYKRAALKASAPVVGILSRIGGMEIFRGSGFVIECNARDNKFVKFVSTILTSATNLRRQPHIDALANNIEISVILTNGITCKGIVSAYDFHYNIGLIEIGTDVQVATAELRNIDDSISINPDMLYENSPKYHHQSNKYNLIPGDMVVALGRYHAGQNSLMVVAGEFSATETGFDCQELFRAEFRISRDGIGGPIINCYGEVIGISFYCASFTPFLPINIASMWREQMNTNRHVPRLGMQLSSLYMWGAAYLETFVSLFPNNFKGSVINEITSATPAFSTKTLPRDVIVKCDGKPVGSILEFFELIWHKVGEPVNLTLLRPSDGSEKSVTMTVDKVGPSQINRWPLAERKGKIRLRSL